MLDAPWGLTEMTDVLLIFPKALSQNEIYSMKFDTEGPVVNYTAFVLQLLGTEQVRSHQLNTW